MAVVRAEASRAAGQRTVARDALLQALEREPSAMLWLRLGAVEAELADAFAARNRHEAVTEHLALAIDAYNHAIAVEPDGEAPATALEATRDLTRHLLGLGMAQAAERRAAEGRVLAPNDPALALLHAEGLGKLGRNQELRLACVEGLAGLTRRADPLAAQLHLRHGQVLRKLKRPAEAVEALKAGLAGEVAAAPASCADLWYELAFAHADAAQREEALNASRQYVFWSLHDRMQKPRVAAVQALELGLGRRPGVH
jgi:tetratricopeptide (TPR) repeat protein